MTENLRYVLRADTPLASSTTDLNSKSSWTPEHSTQAQSQSSTAWSSGTEGYSYGTPAENNQARSYATTANGNYYNAYAVTAGSMRFETPAGTIASDTICPKGWTLPVDVDNKSWRNLVTTTYGLQTGTSSTAAMLNQLSNAPISLQVGIGYYSSGSLGFLSKPRAVYMTKVKATANTNAAGEYIMWTDTTGNTPDHDLYRYINYKYEPMLIGYSARCVSR